VNDLTKPERIQLEELETVISNGIQTFAEVGNALLAIREAKLYRAENGTFEAYCKTRWGFARTYAHYLIEGAKVAENIRVHNCEQIPVSEAVARPLTKLPAAEQPAAWQAATDKAKSENRPVTARDVEEVIEKRVADPLDNPKAQTSNKAAEVYTSETMVGLKRYWKQANKKERTAFIKWTETYEN
jgi:hypothetical protein